MGIAGIHAAFLNSSLSAVQYRKALQLAKEGRYKIIYVAPERLMTEEFLAFAAETGILVAILVGQQLGAGKLKEAKDTAGKLIFFSVIFDSFYMWVITIPLAYCLSRFTALDIVWLYRCCQMVDIIILSSGDALEFPQTVIEK